MGGNQVENNATSWSNLPDCKISSWVEIPKLDPSVAKAKKQKNRKVKKQKSRKAEKQKSRKQAKAELCQAQQSLSLDQDTNYLGLITQPAVAGARNLAE